MYDALVEISHLGAGTFINAFYILIDNPLLLFFILVLIVIPFAFAIFNAFRG